MSNDIWDINLVTRRFRSEETQAEKARAQLKRDISDIDALYPIDSQYGITNEIGMKLLTESLQEFDWRNLPPELLHIYAEKCRARESRECARALRDSR